MNSADTTIEVAIEDQIRLEDDLKEAVIRGDLTTAEVQALREKQEAAAREISDLKAKLAQVEGEKLKAQLDKQAAECAALSAAQPAYPYWSYQPYSYPTYVPLTYGTTTCSSYNTNYLQTTTISSNTIGNTVSGGNYATYYLNNTI